MNYIDIALIAFVSLGFIFGFMGKFGKKISSLLFVIIAVAAAYFLTGMAIEKISTIDASILASVGGQSGQTVMEFLQAKISSFVSESMPSLDASAIAGLVTGIIKLLVFWLLAIVFMLVLSIVGGIITSLILIKAPKHTGWKSFGIFGAIKGAIVAVVLFLPVFVLAPVASNLSEVIDNPIVEKLGVQVSESKATTYTTKFLEKGCEEGGFKLSFLTYDSGDKKGLYLYSDIKSVPGLLKIASLFVNSDSEADPMAAILEMSNDDLKAMFESINESETVKTIVTGVIDGVATELGVDIDVSNIDLAKEADTIIVMKDVLNDVNNGTLEETLADTEKLGEIAGTLANSDLAIALVGTVGEGMLADIGTENIDSIKGQITASLQANEDLTPEEIAERQAQLFKLFEAPAAE